jgi:hypothetical protein
MKITGLNVALALLLAILASASCGDGTEQINPGAKIPIYRVSQQWIDAHYASPATLHGGTVLYGVFDSKVPAVYFVAGHDFIVVHELGHVADFKGGHWQALKAVDSPAYNVYQDRK